MVCFLCRVECVESHDTSEAGSDNDINTDYVCHVNEGLQQRGTAR
jgi:hypothetical protein